MERTIKCVKFQSKRILESLAVFTMIYLLFYVAMIAAFAISPYKGNFSGSYFLASLIFLYVVIAALYNGIFNSLLMFGNTRCTILTSFYLTSLWLSALVAILSELNELLNSSLSHTFRFATYSGVGSIYHNLNPLSELLLFFTLFLLVTMIAYIYGALSYKIGKIFRIIFWCGFALVMMFTPVPHKYAVIAIKSFLAYNSANGIYLCSLHFFIVAVVLSFILWLIAHRQPQKA